jgi:hypothetical protein
MCPVIEGADLSSVSTKFEIWPEGTYPTVIMTSKFDDKGKNLMIIHKTREPVGMIQAGREYTDFINMTTNAGERNDIGHKSLKRYFEALLPEHANDNPPNSDLLHGLDCKLFISSKANKDTDEQRNYVKKILKA